MGGINVKDEIDGDAGYSLRVKLSQSDLALLRQMIHVQWLYRLQLLVPKEVKQFSQLGITNYHQMSSSIEHSKVWPKTSRVLPKDAVTIIRNMSFFKKLESEFGNFAISDEESLGWENIYWRIVRPGNDDIGSLHADKWFWEIGSYGEVADYPHERLKIWIAIETVPEKNGLFVLPGSHRKKDWKWHSEIRYSLKKPIFDESTDNLNMVLLPLEPGETVVFHDELIHGGAPNLADITRVSLEFTLLLPKA